MYVYTFVQSLIIISNLNCSLPSVAQILNKNILTSEINGD